MIILNAVFIWNDFLTPLIYLGGTPNETLPVVVYQFVGQYVSNWGYIFAAVVMASLPILARLPAAAALRDQGLRQRTEGLSMRAVGLRCEHREDVPCIDDPAPRLSWPLESDGRRPAPDRLPHRRGHDGDTLWDSGEVDGSASVDVPYAGRPLPAGARVHVDGPGLGRGRRACPDWSEPARFRTGLAAWTRVAGSAATACHDPAVPVPGDGDEADPDDAMLGRCRRARTSAARSQLARRRARARRCTPPRAACWSSSSTARASATPSWRPAGPTTARGSSTRRTT